MESNFKYKKNSPQIFGADYDREQDCKRMVIFGMQYLTDRPDTDMDDFDSIKKLKLAMDSHIGGKSNASQMMTAINHVLYAYEYGWDNYLKQIENGDRD